MCAWANASCSNVARSVFASSSLRGTPAALSPRFWYCFRSLNIGELKVKLKGRGTSLPGNAHMPVCVLLESTKASRRGAFPRKPTEAKTLIRALFQCCEPDESGLPWLLRLLMLAGCGRASRPSATGSSSAARTALCACGVDAATPRATPLAGEVVRVRLMRPDPSLA